MENGSSEEPNCMFTSGFLAGLFAEVLDKTVQARETRCISQGQPECEFEISTTEPTSEETAEVKEPVKETTSQPAKETPSPPTKPPDEAKPTKSVVPMNEPKTVPKAMSPFKDQPSQPPSPEKNQNEVDAGVERASRIAKRKQGFWEKHFKKKD
jgi:outer membrane biosynthesis protein TonB